MLNIHKQELAEKDLKGIWLYSFENWGETQADKYYDELDEGFKTLCHNPEIGKDRGSIRKGYRSFQINRHVVYYKVTASTIHIIRVLHESMDVEHHL